MDFDAFDLNIDLIKLEFENACRERAEIEANTYTPRCSKQGCGRACSKACKKPRGEVDDATPFEIEDKFKDL